MAGSVGSAGAKVAITVDASKDRHPISPLIYGVCFGSKDQLHDLNATLNRQGGNNFSRYNWHNNTLNVDNDWYFESIPGFFLGESTSFVPAQRLDSFVERTRAASAQPMVSIPMIGWVAKVTSRTHNLHSFSVAKYGPQQRTDPGDPDAGNGIKPDGTPITGNDPNDANQRTSVRDQRGLVEHLTERWGTAAHGGVRYYILDNEPGLWNSTHRDVHPKGFTYDEYLNDFLSYASMVKAVDPAAKVVGPEEWGWPGFKYSGSDWQYRGEHHYQGHPDADAHGGVDFMPWLLKSIHDHEAKTGKRLLDVFTFHIYPQGVDYDRDNSTRVCLMRNRSTRSLWDPNYKDESWINDTIMMIPRLRKLVDTYDPGTKIGITEYNWGGEKIMNGATAQADILGIFGREGLDLATRWTAPKPSTTVFNAFKMYRNYDGHESTFGDVSVSDTVPDPDTVSSFAAYRSTDHALTVIAINKQLDDPAEVDISINGFPDGHSAQVWQLSGVGASIVHAADVPVVDHRIKTVLPKCSITLFVAPESRHVK
jgi:hypothetical protein